MRGFISKIRHGFRTGEFFPFEAFDQRLPYFHHHHNCGFPGKRRTERTVELAIADWWLKQHPDAVEVGAVTPYYWPGRVANVIDPADSHRAVTDRISLFDFDFSNRDILSISTVEHIGEHRYGLNEPRTPMQAIEKISGEARKFVITFPSGWRPELDEFVFSGEVDRMCRATFLVRNDDETWSRSERRNAKRPYGGENVTWANCLIILTNPAGKRSTYKFE